MEVSQCIAVVSLGDKKVEYKRRGFGGIKNVKPGLINNGGFYQQFYFVLGNRTLSEAHFHFKLLLAIGHWSLIYIISPMTIQL